MDAGNSPQVASALPPKVPGLIDLDEAYLRPLAAPLLLSPTRLEPCEPCPGSPTSVRNLMTALRQCPASPSGSSGCEDARETRTAEMLWRAPSPCRAPTRSRPGSYVLAPGTAVEDDVPRPNMPPLAQRAMMSFSSQPEHIKRGESSSSSLSLTTPASQMYCDKRDPSRPSSKRNSFASDGQHASRSVSSETDTMAVVDMPMSSVGSLSATMDPVAELAAYYAQQESSPLPQANAVVAVRRYSGCMGSPGLLDADAGPPDAWTPRDCPTENRLSSGQALGTNCTVVSWAVSASSMDDEDGARRVSTDFGSSSINASAPSCDLLDLDAFQAIQQRLLGGEQNLTQEQQSKYVRQMHDLLSAAQAAYSELHRKEALLKEQAREVMEEKMAVEQERRSLMVDAQWEPPAPPIWPCPAPPQDTPPHLPPVSPLPMQGWQPASPDWRQAENPAPPEFQYMVGSSSEPLHAPRRDSIVRSARKRQEEHYPHPQQNCQQSHGLSVSEELPAWLSSLQMRERSVAVMAEANAEMAKTATAMAQANAEIARAAAAVAVRLPMNQQVAAEPAAAGPPPLPIGIEHEVRSRQVTSEFAVQQENFSRATTQQEDKRGRSSHVAVPPRRRGASANKLAVVSSIIGVLALARWLHGTQPQWLRLVDGALRGLFSNCEDFVLMYAGADLDRGGGIEAPPFSPEAVAAAASSVQSNAASERFLPASSAGAAPTAEPSESRFGASGCVLAVLVYMAAILVG
eukprot:TRINITY_DN5768_c0_g1_i2.p1 TRINITY_DN5768_c0_g1~~TRINITY_DN5768_c0_g1_i2.p1  ORF type:complete len:744 (+),score=154.47 TRINITY_DN5768_c0_g1_i2:133-2364(+)